MRNSNCLAIAPTATISNIIGVAQSIEPTYQNLFVKSNLSGEFTVVNEYLVRDLKKLDLWDEVMITDLKYFDGSLRRDRPHSRATSRRSTRPRSRSSRVAGRSARRAARSGSTSRSRSTSTWPGASGKKLDETYKLAWLRGLKTTYYLRTLGATYAEKSTVKSGQLNAVSNGSASDGLAAAAPAKSAKTANTARPAAAEPALPMANDAATDVKFCAIDDPECEACQ